MSDPPPSPPPPPFRNLGPGNEVQEGQLLVQFFIFICQFVSDFRAPVSLQNCKLLPIRNRLHLLRFLCLEEKNKIGLVEFVTKLWIIGNALRVKIF